MSRELLLKEEIRTVRETSKSMTRELLLKEAVLEDKEEDRISNLPDGILHHILFFLPVKSIAKTSLLSTRWNYLWTTLPCLDFSELSMEDRHERKSEAMELIMKTVLAARHPNFNIKVFRFKGNLGLAYLLDCIRQLVRHRIEELELDVSLGDEICYLPPCVFTCDSLKSLTLETRLSFKVHSYNLTGTSGFPSLQELSLKRVQFMDKDLDALFSASSFPALKRLTLKNCIGINRLNIGCPELEDLQVERTTMNVLDISAGERLKNLRVIHSFRASKNESCVKIFAPKLETFCWQLNEIPEKYSVQSFPFLKKCSIHITPTRDDPININNAMSFLSGVLSSPKLYFNIIYMCTTKIFPAIHLEGGLRPFPLLRTLQVFTCLNKSEIPGIVCLLRNVPFLQVLNLEIGQYRLSTRDNKWGITLLDNSGYTEEQYWESEAQVLRSFLDHLKVLKINVHFSMHETVIIATRFLLKHGNALEKVTLISNHQEWKEESIFGFPRGSPHVKISIREKHRFTNYRWAGQ